jgi:hypothetical protein
MTKEHVNFPNSITEDAKMLLTLVRGMKEFIVEIV